jgi:putative ATP-binding cassette transporter
MSYNNLKFDKKFFCDLWNLLRPYWVSEEKKSAWGLLLLTITCVFGEATGGVMYNYFYKFFYNALQAIDQWKIIYALCFFLAARLLLTLSMSGVVLFGGLLGIRWRRWLTKDYLKIWLHDHNHYRMQVLTKNVDNPDQRISEDLDSFATQTLHLLFGPWMLLQSFLYLISFGYILWDLSKNFVFHIASSSLRIPGYLFWVALLYAMIGIWLINWVGNKLSSLDCLQQRLNADFRFSLVRFREASEQVSLSRGEAMEKEKFHGLFDLIFCNFIDIVFVKTRTSLFYRGYDYLSYAIGFAISMPFFLSRAIGLGIVMQISSAYGSVISGFFTFISSFSEFADWRAVIHRLTEFRHSIAALPQVIDQDQKIVLKKHHASSLIVSHLQLTLPHGKKLLQPIDLEINRGEWILLSGPSGCGKSTFLRTLAGIWVHGEGEIHVPSTAKVLFLPQKPYLPLGSLKELLSYPHCNYSDDSIEEVLTLCHLEKFKSQLNEIKNWSHQLSLGEQQLVSFARLLLYEPDLLFLDEATSSLDEATEAQLYETLKRRLPHITLVSVGHRSTLRAFHERIINC